MSDVKNIPKQMVLPFDVEDSHPKAEVISFFARKEMVLAAQSTSSKISDSAEMEIIKRVLERADRLVWYK